MNTKSIQSLNLEGRHIKLYPEDVIEKWATITHVTTEGMIVKINKVERSSKWNCSSYEVGMEYFINWSKASFRFEDTPKGEDK